MRGLVCLDLDGTLLWEGIFAPGAWEMLERLRRAGYTLAVCTGRLPAGFALEAARRVNAGGRHAFADGALIADACGQIFSRQPLSPETTERILTLMERYRIPADILSAAGRRYHLRGLRPPDLETRVAQNGTPSFPISPDALFQEPPVVVWLSGIAAELWDEAKSLIGDEVYAEVHGPFDGQLHVGLKPRGRHKGFALRSLAEFYGVPLERTVMVGDGKNDVCALEAAGLAIVPENAHPEAKAVTDRVVAPVAEGGLYQVVGELAEAFSR